MAHCIKCGTIIPEGGQFCPKCGAKAVEVDGGQQVSQNIDPNIGQGINPNADQIVNQNAEQGAGLQQAVQSADQGVNMQTSGEFSGQTANPNVNQPVYPNVGQNANFQQINQNTNQAVYGQQANQYVNQAVNPNINQAVNPNVNQPVNPNMGQGVVQNVSAERKGPALFGISAFFISMLGLILFFTVGVDRIILLPTVIASVLGIVLGIIGLVKNGRLKAFPIIAFLICLTNLVLCTIVFVGSPVRRQQEAAKPVNVEYGGMDFQVPGGYQKADSAETYTIYSNPNDDSALLFCTADGRVDDGVFQVSADQFEPGIEELVGQMMTSYKKEGSVFGLVSEKPCYEIVYSGTLNEEEPGYAVVSLINNRAAGQMVFVMIFCPETGKDGALQAYQSMLAAAK